LNAIDVALAAVVPLYVANGTPVIIRGKKAIDFGKKAWDGRRVFGDGKTWEGFIGGVTAGTAAGTAEAYCAPSLMTVELAFALALGALLGDLVAAFFKRRVGLKRGDPAPLLDQLDFVIGGLGLAYLAGFSPSLSSIAMIVIVTPFLHFLTNAAAYLIGLKNVPWRVRKAF